MDPTDPSKVWVVGEYAKTGGLGWGTSVAQLQFAATTGADLVESFVSDPPGTVAMGSSFSVTDTVTNQGTGASGSSTTRYYLSLDTSQDGADIHLTGSRAVPDLAPGETSSGTVTVTVPLFSPPTGTYFLLACADDPNQVLESNEMNNCIASGTKVHIVTTVPDLLMTALPTPTTVVLPGGSLSLSNTVKNQGDVSAGAFVINFLLSANTVYGDGFDIVLTPTRSVSSLAAGASSTASTTLTVPSTTPLGYYYVCAKADSGGAVAEVYENNNTLCTGGWIQVTRPDLVVTNVTPNAATVNNAGATLSVTDAAKNLGLVSSSSFTIAYRLSVNTVYGDADDVVITTTRSVASLEAGASNTATTNLMIPTTTPANNYYVCAKADSASAVSETNETNNTLCSTSTVNVTPPDLIVSAISTTATLANAGDTVSVSNSITNQGGSRATAFVVAFHLSTNTIYGDGDDIASTTTGTISALNAGAINTATTSVLIPSTTPAGTYYLCAKADSANAVSETDETNNTLCSMSPVNVPLPDLRMTDVSTLTTAVAPGGTFSLSNTVKNEVGSSAGSFTIAFHLSADQTYGGGDDIAVTTTRVLTSLASGASSSANTTLTVPSTTPLGNYYICAMADSGGTVSESNETNNTLCTAGTIQVTRPDLIMTAVTPNAATVNQGATLSVTNTVMNQGLVSSGSSSVAFRFSPNAIYGDSDDVVISTTRSVSALAAGASSTATTSLTIPSTTPPNSYHVCAMADRLNAVIETDETNNTLCSSTQVTVPAADLVMTAVSTTATAVAPGKTFTFSNTVKNQGGSKAGAFTIAFHLSSDATYGGADDIATTATRSLTALAIGASSVGTTTLTVPAATPLGTYYVCAIADSGNTVAEGDENNNSRCTAAPIQITRADLVMTAVTPNAATVNRGSTLSVSNTVQDQGLIAGTAFRIGFRLSVNNVYGDGDDVVITTIRSLTSLAAGASSSATTSISIPGTTPVGTYYVCAMADSLNAVIETNEGNNTLCSGVTVTVQ